MQNKYFGNRENRDISVTAADCCTNEVTERK